MNFNPMIVPLSRKHKPVTQKECRLRAEKIKLVLTDNDGVLTDTGVYYSERGEELKRFSIRDGMGVERLRHQGIETAIITGEMSGSVKKRAEKLNMPFLYLGVKDKRNVFEERVLPETGLRPEEIAYIGDDVNDYEIMSYLYPLSLTGSPEDAIPIIHSVSHYEAKACGGNGAFRDFAEWILSLRIPFSSLEV